MSNISPTLVGPMINGPHVHQINKLILQWRCVPIGQPHRQLHQFTAVPERYVHILPMTRAWRILPWIRIGHFAAPHHTRCLPQLCGEVRPTWMLPKYLGDDPGEDRGVGEGATWEWRAACPLDVRSCWCGKIGHCAVYRWNIVRK